MYPLKISTAITVPFFAHDSNGDGVTGKVDGDFTKRISKNGGAFSAMSVAVTEMENGWYSLPVSTSHSDTAGVLSISLSAAGIKRVNLQFRVGSLVFDDLASPTNITAGTITTATNVTTVNGLAANVITATSINADAITAAKIADGAIDAATFAAGAITAAAIATDAITAGKIAADAIGASELAADAVTEIQSGLASQSTADAIKTKTDQLAFTIANHIDANIQRINDVTITGNGQVGTEFGV